MRVGKKLTVVQAKQTRSCVVPQLNIVTRSSISASKTLSQSKDEGKLKVPLKKPPVTRQEAVKSTTMGRQPKDKEKVRPTPQKLAMKVSPASVSKDLPPTIAAGRSRRAIKPNPKYAGDDMVTPKSIKHGTPSSIIYKGSFATGEKTRKLSVSSLEDFFNKESSEEYDDNDIDFDSNTDKAYNLMEKDSDSDFNDFALDSPKPQKARPRSKAYKNISQEVGTHLANATPVKSATKLSTNMMAQSTTTAGVKYTPTAAKSITAVKSAATATTSVVKSTSTHLQQLRKSVAGNVNRTSAQLTGKKRKLDSQGSDIEKDDENEVTRKRLLLSTAVPKYKLSGREAETSTLQTNKNTAVRKSINMQTLNGKKVDMPKIRLDQIKTGQEKPKSLLESTTTDSIGSPVTRLTTKVSRTTKIIDQLPLTIAKGGSPKQPLIPVGTRRSASPITPKSPASKVATQKKDLVPSEDKKDESSPGSVADDFETMPTFTIVNINDIINKKGDARISKSKTSFLPTIESKLNKRKTIHGEILSEKIDPDRIKSKPLATVTSPMMASKNILSHKLLNKAANIPINQRSTRNASVLSPFRGSAGFTTKSAPRILNSMVGRKTLPIKPQIACLDDSADETFPLSPGEEENLKRDIESEEIGDDGEENNDTGDASFAGKRKFASSTPFQTSNKATPAIKENLLTGTKRLSTKLFQPKAMPESVIISRQGNKIVKKITCFETWYVVQVPEERPAANLRNLLEMPLILLANRSTKVKLPTSNWSCKVTLFELSPSLLAKSRPILFTGDIKDHNIAEENRAKYQPSSVMYRRKVNDFDFSQTRLPYDRAVIFKNKTFFTNIDGKNVKLVAAPTSIKSLMDIEVLLQIVDSLTLTSMHVELASILQ